MRRGSVAGFSEGQIARQIALLISAAVTDLNLDVPDEAWFGPYLTRLTDWVDRARRAGLGKTLVVILDEFDELNSALYLGQRGDNFFATLRSLSERQVAWFFVGGERMPGIFRRHHATLNQVEVFQVDRVTDPRDVEDMIVGPMRGKLDWDAEAVEFVRQITAGNPYYVHLVCSRVLKEMYNARRTFIDRADVAAAAKSITTESTPTHWGHFWEDNSEVEPELRQRRGALSAALLAAIGTSELKYGNSVPLISLRDSIETLGVEKDNLDSVLEVRTDLVQRGVLEEKGTNSDIRYQTTIPLFSDFLYAQSRTVVFPFYKQYLETTKAETASAKTVATINILNPKEAFPVEEEELIAISDGLIYQGVPIDAVRIRAWLKQFPDESAIVLATKLARRMKERYYLDLSQVRRAIEDVYKWLLDQLLANGYKAPRMAGNRIVSIHVAYLGDASKSGADTARELKTQKRFARCASIFDALRWVKNDLTYKPDEKFVLIVDDFVGTGNQSKANLLAVVNRLRQDDTLLHWAKQGRLLFAPLWAYAEGVDNIHRDIGDLVRIQPARNLDDEDRAFSPSSRIFESDDERRYAEGIFYHIGQQLQADAPLGYGGCQSLIVFENTVPNDSLTALWYTGIVDERPWRPLFPRP